MPLTLNLGASSHSHGAVYDVPAGSTSATIHVQITTGKSWGAAQAELEWSTRYEPEDGRGAQRTLADSWQSFEDPIRFNTDTPFHRAVDIRGCERLRLRVITAGTGTTVDSEAKVVFRAFSTAMPALTDADGRLLINAVITPQRTYEFRAVQTALQSVTNSTWTKLAMDSEEFDPDAVFDGATNYRYQPTEAGVYLVTGVVEIVSLGDTFRVEAAVYMNGTVRDYGSKVAQEVGISGDHRSVVTSILRLNGSSDYLELWAWHNHATSRSTSPDRSRFAGARIG